MSSSEHVVERDRDLATRTEIHDLVVGFYREIVFDELLEPVFGEVAEVDWAIHIPKLIDYWCRVLLRQPGYEGSILEAHQHVHDLKALNVEHFDRWYALWVVRPSTPVGRAHSPSWPRSTQHGWAAPSLDVWWMSRGRHPESSGH